MDDLDQSCFKNISDKKSNTKQNKLMRKGSLTLFRKETVDLSDTEYHFTSRKKTKQIDLSDK